MTNLVLNDNKERPGVYRKELLLAPNGSGVLFGSTQDERIDWNSTDRCWSMTNDQMDSMCRWWQGLKRQKIESVVNSLIGEPVFCVVGTEAWPSECPVAHVPHRTVNCVCMDCHTLYIPDADLERAVEAKAVIGVFVLSLWPAQQAKEKGQNALAPS